MSNLKMFILTHKPFESVIPSNEEIYTTVLNGAELKGDVNDIYIYS